MANRIGESTIRLERPAVILATAAVGSKLEKEGPLGGEFDMLAEDSYFGEESWEKAETRMQLDVMRIALQKGSAAPEEIDIMLGGDLLNQCIASAYAVREMGRPFLGLYGACSTMAESLALGALLLDGGGAAKILATTSSHFCSSERQFRFPLDYGGVRAPTSQHTATAAGAALLACGGSGVKIEEVCIGRVIDLGITDVNNMGAAMAPAAWDTLKRFFADTGTSPAEYDRIITGDLAHVGSDLLVRLADEDKVDLRPYYTDCGIMLYDMEKQQVDAGASGCGCSAAVMAAHFLPAMANGKYHNVLFLATGALMSPTACQQGESIPGVAHLVHLSAQ